MSCQPESFTFPARYTFPARVKTKNSVGFRPSRVWNQPDSHLTRRFLLAMVYLSHVSCSKNFQLLEINIGFWETAHHVTVHLGSKPILVFHWYFLSVVIWFVFWFPLHPIEFCQSARGFPVKRSLYKFGGLLVFLMNCSSNRTTIYTGFVCSFSSAFSKAP